MQALGQCRHYLRANGITPIAYADTAAAAAFVADSDDEGAAAVAAPIAAGIYGLEMIQEGIEDDDRNTTRFVVLSREPVIPDAGSDTLMTFRR